MKIRARSFCRCVAKSWFGKGTICGSPCIKCLRVARCELTLRCLRERDSHGAPVTAKLAFEVSPFGVRFVCIRTLANVDSRSIQDTTGLISGQLSATGDQVKAQFEQSSFLRTLAKTVQDTANAAVLVASDRGRMLTGTVVNATAGAALD